MCKFSPTILFLISLIQITTTNALILNANPTTNWPWTLKNMSINIGVKNA